MSEETKIETKAKSKKEKKEVKTEYEIKIDELKALAEEVLNDDDTSNKEIKVGFSKKRASKKEQQHLLELANAQRFYPDYKMGLDDEQVKSRKDSGLVNKATHSNAKTYRSIFFENIFTFFNLICIIIASAMIYAKANLSDFTFSIIMIVNTVIGISQEIRAKRMVDKLSLISSPIAVVIRGGERVTIPIEEVVLDDIIFLENGKQISADSIIVKGSIEVNESLLTGESALISKKDNAILYAGSFVSSGSCFAKVEKIGNGNYIESLTSFARKYKKAPSELLQSLKRIISTIGFLIVPLGLVMFFNNYKLYNVDADSLEAIRNTIIYTAGALLGMIPAGMFLLTSVALGVSVVRLGQNHVLVQDTYCIEMLARTNVLCLDKTGTITDGTMKVSETISFHDTGDYLLGDIIGSILTATGDNNQTAMALANKFGYSKVLKPVSILPFSSERKYSAVSFESQGTYILVASEFVLGSLDGKLEKIIAERAKEGLRIILLAYTASEIKGEKISTVRKPIALICIEDHIRNDAIETIKWFKENDVKVKVISGDNPITVSEVASRAGIENAEVYISLEGLSDYEVVEASDQYTVFGRVTPEQKRILIKSMKLKGNTVAMTGDGVNDILALKEADCSISMASGSEAARNVSHMVLTDSNFSHMPLVVKEGRRVVNNIQKSSTLFLMKTLFSILLSIVIILFQIPYPMRPSQLLLLELFIIGAPSFFLAFQSNINRIRGRFLENVLKETLPSGLTLVLGFVALYIYSLFNTIDSEQFTTMTVLITTFIGWVLLMKVCLPLDLYRALVSAFSLTLSLLVVYIFGKEFYLVKLDLTNTLVVLIIVQSSYAVTSALKILVNQIKV